MAIEKRTIDGEEIEFDTVLGGAVLHVKDPARVEAGKKAARTAKRHAKQAKAAPAANSEAAVSEVALPEAASNGAEASVDVATTTEDAPGEDAAS